MKKIFVILILIYSICAVHAQSNLSSSQKDVLKIIMSEGGYIDKKLYDKFWKGIDKSTLTDKEIIKLKKILISSSKIQRQTQLDAKRSIKLGKPYYSDATLKNLEIMKNNNIYKKAADSTIRYIEHAASGKPLNTINGLIYIDIDLVNKILANLDAAIERAGYLIQKEWILKRIQRKLTDDIEILWELPFNSDEFSTNNMKFYSFSSSIDLNSAISIGISKDKSRSISLKNCVNGMADQMAANDIVIEDTKIKGYDATSSLFYAKSSSGKMYFEVACINYNYKLLSLISISNSPIDATVNFDKLKQNLKLKRIN